MSLETWKAEFYPVPAEECPKPLALQHSLRKWEGLTTENLDKHELVRERDGIVIKDSCSSMSLGSLSCALCEYYLYTSLHDCLNCPILRRTGKTCDTQWYVWYWENNPQPMIDLLRRVDKLPDCES